MASRQSLQTKLEEILGTRNVYFQSPGSNKMSYPSIVYELSDISNRNANNNVYAQYKYYQVTVIDYNPDSLIVDKVSKLPKVRFNRQFKSDNLYHTVFKLQY